MLQLVLYTLDWAERSRLNLYSTVRKSKNSRPKPRLIEFRSMKNFNLPNFLADLKRVPWLRPIHIQQCRWCMGSLANTFQRCSWPARASNIKKKWIRCDQLAWISPDLLREISHRKKLFKRHKRSPTSTSWDDYKRQRNMVTSLKRNALKRFFCDASLTAKHPGEFWRKMKPLLPTSSGKNI